MCGTKLNNNMGKSHGGKSNECDVEVVELGRG